MGQIFGIFAKSKGRLIKHTPIKAEKESYYSLANIFKDCENYISRILITSKLDPSRKKWLKLKPEEVRALKYNNIQDFADGEIEYRKSVGESLKPDFFAIGMTFDEQMSEIVYSPKYHSLENWSRTEHTLDALYKIKEVLFEDLRTTIESHLDYEDKRYSLDNIQILLTTIRTLKSFQILTKWL